MDKKQAEKIISNRKLLRDVGGYYSSDGESYAGISRTEHPDWIGWQVVDQYQPLHPGAFIGNRYLEQMVLEFYATTG